MASHDITVCDRPGKFHNTLTINMVTAVYCLAYAQFSHFCVHRSPPISLPGGPVFPSSQHFGTMRGPPQMFQSQDAINSTTSRQPPIPTINRPTVAPPRPPNNKPPPPPIRSVSNTNLTTLPLSVAPSSVSAGANTSFGSASNVSTLKEQYAVKSPIGAANSVNNVSTLHNSNSNSNSTNNTSAAVAANNYVSSSSSSHGSSSNIAPAKERSPNGNAPPLPPHRTCPAPPPPMRQTSNVSSLFGFTDDGCPRQQKDVQDHSFIIGVLFSINYSSFNCNMQLLVVRQYWSL